MIVIREYQGVDFALIATLELLDEGDHGVRMRVRETRETRYVAKASITMCDDDLVKLSSEIDRVMAERVARRPSRR